MNISWNYFSFINFGKRGFEGALPVVVLIPNRNGISFEANSYHEKYELWVPLITHFDTPLPQTNPLLSSKCRESLAFLLFLRLMLITHIWFEKIVGKVPWKYSIFLKSFPNKQGISYLWSGRPTINHNW